jgi:predicted MFS family arabinose efflux permease
MLNGLTYGRDVLTNLDSTPLNRARTLVPLTASFSAGMALGPAFGGFLANHVGVSNTFLTVGTGYLIIMMVNRALLNETKMCKSVRI